MKKIQILKQLGVHRLSRSVALFIAPIQSFDLQFSNSFKLDFNNQIIKSNLYLSPFYEKN